MESRCREEEFKLLLDDLYFRLEERDRWSDHSLRYLLTGNGGGVALLITLLGALGKNGQWQPLLLLPLTCFLVGVIFVGLVVGHSAQCVKQGRDGLIKLIHRYLDRELSYEEVFRK